MEKKQFQAESKRLLDLMINSIYTHREIFLRELISNASDAIDKLYYHSLNENISGLSRSDFFIELKVDKEKKTFTIRDNGCGMTKEDLEANLGTIAQSGSLAFKKENTEKQEDIDIIGQFGVGFYSAFMVAQRVTVISRAFNSDTAWRWESEGADGYTIEEYTGGAERGTTIELQLKENTDEDKYDEFLEPHRISGLVKKYSDYIRYPIRMDMPTTRRKEGSPDDKPEYETIMVNETLNSMVPIWKKAKSEVTDEDYENFYKDKFFDFEKPARIIHSTTEGSATYNALLFVPSHAPYNFYSDSYKKGLQLYASGVLIMDCCEDLLPDCFAFVKGLVDSQDLSLNISREMLQHDRQLKLIASRLEKKIHSELLSMQQNERENYDKFFENFGLQIKFDLYKSFGGHSELLRDLLMFYSSSEKKLVTLSEYVGRMKESQKYIYYACGETNEKIELLPQTERLREQGFEILYLTENVDEFTIKQLRAFEEKEFRSVSDQDLGLESEEEKEEIKKQSEDNKDLLACIKDALGDKVKEVRLTGRLKSHPVCLASNGELSLDMEKVLNAMPHNDHKVQAERVLELNANHPMFESLKKLYSGDKDKVSKYADLLYTQALLIEGMPVEDPVAFSNAICDLMISST